MTKRLLPLLAVGVLASPAMAVPTINFTQGSTALPGYTTATTFENFTGQAAGTPFVAATYASPAQTIIETGSNNPLVESGSVPGIASNPSNNTSTNNGQYLSILGGTSFTVSFSTPVQFFSFILGSLDTYNSLTLNYSDGTPSTVLTGASIVNQAVTFTTGGNSSVAGRVSYDFGGGSALKSAVFSSTQDSFEIDGLAAAVPEAATWAMMMVGLGVVGGALRRRRNTSTSVRFA